MLHIHAYFVIFRMSCNCSKSLEGNIGWHANACLVGLINFHLERLTHLQIYACTLYNIQDLFCLKKKIILLLYSVDILANVPSVMTSKKRHTRSEFIILISPIFTCKVCLNSDSVVQ